MKTEKERIDRIIGNGGDIAAAISCLRNDGNDIIIGEYVNSILRFRLASEGTNPDGTGWKEEYTRVVIHKREESNSLTDEAVAVLKFHLASGIGTNPNNEGVILISPDVERNPIPIASPPSGDDFKSVDSDVIVGDFKSDKHIIRQDGTVQNPVDPMSPSSLANGDGFELVDAIIEPWFAPFWNMDSILVAIQRTDSVSITRMYSNLLELIKEFPIFEYIGEKIGVRLMDIESIKEVLKVFPEEFVRMVANFFAEKHQCVINGKITVDQDAADDFVAGLHLLEKLLNAGFITFEAEKAIDEPAKS